MTDRIKEIVEQVARVAEQAAAKKTGITTATVLSRNPDGTYVVDDGSGGCARQASITNQQVTCGSQVVLGTEPQIGQTSTVCPVSVTITPSTKDCPSDDRTDDNEDEVVLPMIGFLDNRGRRYDFNTGDFLAFGAETADVDSSFGYSFDGLTNECKTGATPTYDDLLIGDLDDGSGTQGETYSTNSTVLCQGAGTASGVLCGAEIENTVGGHEAVWILTLRNATTYALIASDPATFIQDWMSGHASEYPGDNVDYDVNITADPDGDSFWIGIGGNNNANQNNPWDAAMFRVSSDDLTLMATVALHIPAFDGELDSDFFRRANRFAG